MITKVIFLLFLVFPLSISSYAQSKWYDVDSLLIFYEDSVSVIYLKENGDTVRPRFGNILCKLKQDSVRLYQMQRYIDRTKEHDLYYTVFAWLLFEKFKIQEVRIVYGLETQNTLYNNIIKDILKEMEDIWEIPAYNDSIPILKLVRFGNK